MTVVTNIDDAGKMLRKRGLETGGRVQKYFTARCAAEMDRYVPFQSGMLKNGSRRITADSVIYNAPYARMMYYGQVMVDPVTGAAGFLTSEGWRSRKGVKKIVSTREFSYNGAPLRGKLWDIRMWATCKQKIISGVAAMAGGVAR